MAEFFARLVPKKSTQPGEVPNPDLDLIEGEIAVNTADGKIWTKHSDGTLVPLGGEAGEGGSVGDVFRRTAQFWGNSKKTTDTPAEVVGAGAWCVRTDLQGITVSEFSADGSRFDGNAYTSGSQITLTVNEQELVFTLAADPTQVVDQLFTFEFTEDTTSLNNLLNGTDLVAIGLVTTDAEDGDILVWSDECQCWLAEAPPVIPDVPVQSVNGEVGEVSLGIQDMDDFSLNQIVSSESSFSDLQRSGTWSEWMDAHSFSPGLVFPTSQSEWRAYKDTSNEEGAIQIASLDDDSNSSEDWVNVSFANLLLLITVDGQTYGPIPVKTINDVGSYGVVIKWDISDFDPSLYSWGYEVGNPARYPTDPRPIKPFTIQLGYTLSAGSVSYDPLAEGDHLEWDATDEAFKPTQLATVAKTGSYNDLTDQPTIPSKIQDAEDFALNQAANTIIFPNKATNYVAIAAEGDWSADVWGGSGGGFLVSWLSAANGGGDLATQAELIAGGDTVTLKWPDGSTSTETVATAYTSGDRKAFVINDPHTSNWSGHSDGTELWITSDKFTGDSDIPLAEGDHLQWSEANQAFMPVQLDIPEEIEPGISKIQDAEDYKPQQLPGTILANEKGINYTDVCDDKWIFDTYRADDYMIGLGKDHPHLDEYKKLEVGDEVTFTWPDETQTVATVGGIYSISNTSNECYQNCRWFWFPGNDPAGAQLDGPLKIESVKFTTAADVPLVEGDMLRWDDNEQAFRPVQLDIPEEIEPGIQRIQDAEDFALNQIPAVGYTYSSQASVSIDSGDPGYARYATNFSNPRPFIINEEDSSGTNLRDALLLLSAGDKFWWSFDGGFTFEAFTIGTIAEGVAGRWDLRPIVSPSGSWSSNNDSPWERGSDWQLFFAEPAGAQDVPLAEGDHLRWSDADQAFKPVQLDPAFSGDYNDLANTPDLSLKADLVGGKVPADQLPAIAVSEFLGTVADEAAMLALTGQSGDWCVRVDTDSAWILSADDASVLANWIELGGGAGNVVSVNDKTGAVSLGIQDMDDFKYNTLQRPVAYRFVDNVSGTVNAVDTGSWIAYDFTTSNRGFSISTTDADGNTLPAPVGTTWYWSTSADGPWTEQTIKQTSPSATTYKNICDNRAINFPASGEIYWTQDLSAPIEDIPLAEGDHLKWSDAEQAFMPVQLTYSDLPDTPTLAAVATSGSYDDLVDVPAEFAPESHTHDISEITGQTFPAPQFVGGWGGPKGIYNDADGGITMDFPAAAITGDLAIVMIAARNQDEGTGVPTDWATAGGAEDGWTRHDQRLFDSEQSFSSKGFMALFTKALTAEDIATGWVRFAASPIEDGSSDHFPKILIYRNAQVLDWNHWDSTVPGTTHSSWKTFSDALPLTQSVVGVALGYNIYSWTDPLLTTWRVRKDDGVLTEHLGSFTGLEKRVASFEIKGDNTSFELAFSQNPTDGVLDLTDGAHLYVLRLSYVDPSQQATDWLDIINKPTEYPPEAHTHRIQDAEDYKPQPFNAFPHDFRWSPKTAGTPATGEWGTNQLHFSPTDADGKAFNTTGSTQMWLSPDVSTWQEITAEIKYYSEGDYYYISTADIPDLHQQIEDEAWASIYLNFTDPDTVDLGAAPLAEGDILQWNNAIQKFQPVQLETGSSSWNDLTDKPTEYPPEAHTHQIQDAEDFALSPYPTPLSLFYDQADTPASTSEQGYARYATNFGGRKPFIINEVDSNGVSRRDQLLQLSNGDSFWWSFDNGFTVQAFTVYQIDEVVEGRWDIKPDQSPQPDANGGWDSSNDTPQERGTNWILYFNEPLTGEMPLAQGDVLSWDDGIKKFTPEQLNLPASYVTSLDDLDDVDTTTVAPADKQVLAWDESQLRWMPRTDPAAPVQSVQGKTGDVRLTIQEMDDYQLRYESLPGALIFAPQSSFNTYVNNENGTWSWQNATKQQLSWFDADGNDLRPNYYNFWEDGHTIKWEQNGTELGRGQLSNFRLDDTYDRALWDVVGGTISKPFPPEDPVIVTNLTLNPETRAAIDIPLAESDVLLWDDNAAKFRPTPFSWNNLLDKPTISTGGVDSVNGQTGVVSLGMNDLNDVVSDYTPDNRAEWTQLASGTPTNRAPKNPGEWGYFEGGEGNRQLRLNYLDGVNNDWSAAMSGMPASGTLYVSQDDVAFLALPYRAKSHNTSDGYWSFFVDPYVPPKVDGSLFVSLQPPESPNFQPFAQGSHLEFTGALWQPVQLATVAKSGSYEDLDDKPVIPVPNARVSDGFLFENLSAGDTANGWLESAGKAGMFISVTTDRPAWVRFYTDPISRADDVVNRPAMDENPTRGSGVLLEVITDGTSTYNITPVVNYFNSEKPDPQGRLAVAITNTDGDATFDIQLTVEVLPLEA